MFVPGGRKTKKQKNSIFNKESRVQVRKVTWNLDPDAIDVQKMGSVPKQKQKKFSGKIN